jgi:hypothetical protein
MEPQAVAFQLLMSPPNRMDTDGRGEQTQGQCDSTLNARRGNLKGSGFRPSRHSQKWRTRQCKRRALQGLWVFDVCRQVVGDQGIPEAQQFDVQRLGFRVLPALTKSHSFTTAVGAAAGLAAMVPCTPSAKLG